MEEERSVFLQSTVTTGFTLIRIQYGDETLAIFPLLINTPEGIATWKENTTLMTALRLLGLQ
ncbi:MAG: hypothetical protein LBG59_08105 [Candidatus Peribacteria bacterium]|nr:hypothetical protein [Candidatus Peribacteria bacterium]